MEAAILKSLPGRCLANRTLGRSIRRRNIPSFPAIGVSNWSERPLSAQSVRPWRLRSGLRTFPGDPSKPAPRPNPKFKSRHCSRKGAYFPTCSEEARAKPSFGPLGPLLSQSRKGIGSCQCQSGRVMLAPTAAWTPPLQALAAHAILLSLVQVARIGNCSGSRRQPAFASVPDECPVLHRRRNRARRCEAGCLGLRGGQRICKSRRPCN